MQLIKYDAACKALAEARAVDEVKLIHDKARALTAAARIAKNHEMEIDASEIRIRAERRLGEMIAEQKNTVGLASGGEHGGKSKIDGTREEPSNPRPTLASAGIDKKLSARSQAIAAIPEAEFESTIAEHREEQKAVTNRTMEKLVRKKERQERVIKMPSGKFAVIYADPPWQYSNSGFDEAAESQYPTMPLEEICDLRDMVNEWATDLTVLFLWATNPLLLEALEVMRAWGFTYKTNIAWVKDKGRGKGWYLRSKHELLLIGTKQNTPHPKIRPDSCQSFKRPARHSQKPEEFYELIESMYDGNKIEMFCRSTRKGWEAHGNEI